LRFGIQNQLYHICLRRPVLNQNEECGPHWYQIKPKGHQIARILRMDLPLFVSKGFDGIEKGSFACRPDAENKSDCHRNT
jgi:hypothetical protein